MGISNYTPLLKVEMFFKIQKYDLNEVLCLLITSFKYCKRIMSIWFINVELMIVHSKQIDESSGATRNKTVTKKRENAKQRKQNNNKIKQ